MDYMDYMDYTDHSDYTDYAIYDTDIYDDDTLYTWIFYLHHGNNLPEMYLWPLYLVHNALPFIIYINIYYIAS